MKLFNNLFEIAVVFLSAALSAFALTYGIGTDQNIQFLIAIGYVIGVVVIIALVFLVYAFFKVYCKREKK